MKDKQEILEIFSQVISGPMNRYVSEWKKSGNKVVGYYCSYIPEELFTSIGVLPYRIRGAGSKDSSVADAYLSARICTFVRHSLALALSGQLDFLDGVVSMNSCDHIRRGFDLWKNKVKPNFSYFISVPRVQEDRVLFWFEEQMEGLKKAVEDHFGKKVTPEGLKSAITLHNRARILLKEVLDLRKLDSSPLSGTEALTVAVASQLIPERDLIPLLEDLLAGLKKSGGGQPARARLVVAGGNWTSRNSSETSRHRAARWWRTMSASPSVLSGIWFPKTATPGRIFFAAISFTSPARGWLVPWTIEPPS